MTTSKPGTSRSQILFDLDNIHNQENFTENS